MPARAKDLAESPSVRMMVHCSAFRVPARLASSSFGMPRSLDFFLPGPRVLASLASSLAFATVTMDSTMPLARTSLRNFSLRVHADPKPEGLVVRVSFVWESKAGFSMRQLTKSQRLPLT